MTKEELIQKLSDLEWEDFEVKAARAEIPKDAWGTVSAFSNTSGGWLLFGVKQMGERFEIQGVTNPEKIEQDFLNTIRGGKFNVLVPTQQERHTVDGNKVLAFYIPASKNMLMHSDHFSPACPRIRIFTDHIEFYNPGGMPKPIEELKGKDISLPRNPIITKLFRVVKLAENAGFGLDNIEYNWKSYNNTIPVFDVDFDSVIVSFLLTQNKKAQEQDKYSSFIEELKGELNHHPANTDAIINLLLSNEEALGAHTSSIRADDLSENNGFSGNSLGTLWELLGNNQGTTG